MKSGVWALFRVLDGGSLEALDASRSRVTFRSGDRTASFALRVEGGATPFDLAALRTFRCPAAL